jgi:hypothetical protein
VTERIELHGPTLRWVEGMIGVIPAMQGGTRLRDELSFAVKNWIMPLAHDQSIVEGSVSKDRCTCRVHNRPSAYALTRKRLGIEARP